MINYFSKNKILGLLILILIVNIVAISTIIYKRNSFTNDIQKDFPPRHSPFEFIKNELNLSEDQSVKFKKIKEESRMEAKLIFDSLRINRNQLMTVLAQAKPNQQSIDSLINKINTLQSKLLQHSIKQYLKLKEILSLEQQLKFNELYKDIFGCDNMRHRKGGKGKHHGGESCQRDGLNDEKPEKQTP